MSFATTPLIVGAALAVAVVLFGRASGFDRDRALYPIVLIVVASYYILFAAMARSASALVPEILGLAAFTALAVIGFRASLWLVAAGLAAHGLFDFLRGGLIENPGVPAWWPAFCLSFDVVAAAGLALLLLRRPSSPRP